MRLESRATAETAAGQAEYAVDQQPDSFLSTGAVPQWTEVPRLRRDRQSD